MTSQPWKRGQRRKQKETYHIWLLTTAVIGHLVYNCTEMRSKICPVCKNKFYSEKKNSRGEFASHNNCKLNKMDKNERRIRTSTPVTELENSPSPSFSDSVTDFFYQSWKSGLHSDDAISRRQSNQLNYQPYAVFQPVCYAPQVVYVNTVIFQPCVPTSCAQPVGYRPDGTFGVLPTYW